jgi:hypothetical protein
MSADACLLVGNGTLFGRLLTYCMFSLGTPLLLEVEPLYRSSVSFQLPICEAGFCFRPLEDTRCDPCM